MKTLRTLLGLNRVRYGVGHSSRFERYYGEVIRSGSGFPTADEARQDMQRADRVLTPYGWTR
ncbi:MAG: hypothetical protein M3R06_10665 [Chloroflexota bacterium]|nr:hypothetical protein [Chloroflexota bacterium]